MNEVCFGACDNDAEVVVQGKHVCRECAALLEAEPTEVASR
ncbi:hypothetical protein [Halobellus ordinarius]|nr:hypothetical protein [Halobellus sp. ZY16]